MNRKIEKIHSTMRKIELSAQQSGLSPAQSSPSDWKMLQELFLNLSAHHDVDIQRLYGIIFHLKETTTLKEFSHWILPVERYLHKDLKDDDFLIFNKDHRKREIPNSDTKLIFILDHVRSSFNVGSIFRSAEAFGIEKIYLVGYTPTPESGKTQKTTLGSHEYVSWELVTLSLPLIKTLKDEGYWVMAAETTSHAIPIGEPWPQKKIAVVFGNERFGLDPEVVAACNETRIVPLQGIKNSLNIANCASLFAYEYHRQFDLAKEAHG